MTGWLDGFAAGNIHSVLVVRHGALAFEHSPEGASTRRGISHLPTLSTSPTIKHDLQVGNKTLPRC